MPELKRFDAVAGEVKAGDTVKFLEADLPRIRSGKRYACLEQRVETRESGKSLVTLVNTVGGKVVAERGCPVTIVREVPTEEELAERRLESYKRMVSEMNGRLLKMADGPTGAEVLAERMERGGQYATASDRLGWYGGEVVAADKLREVGATFRKITENLIVEKKPYAVAQAVVILNDHLERELRRGNGRRTNRSTSMWSNLVEDSTYEAIATLLDGYQMKTAVHSAIKILGDEVVAEIRKENTW